MRNRRRFEPICSPCVLTITAALLLTAGALAAAPGPQVQEDEYLTRAREILARVPLIDGHNDLAYTITLQHDSEPSRVDLNQRQAMLAADIPRLREGMVGGQFWAAFSESATMWTDTELETALTAIDVVRQFVAAYYDLELADTADDVERIFAAGRIGSMIGIEGGHMINNQLAALRLFYELGARYMTLTHFRSTDWADSATDMPLHGGLTEFGERVVREMNRLGMFVDLSHVSDDTMRDALRVSRAPVLYSHSSARGVNPHRRNVPDDILQLVAENGGVVMVNFIAGYVAPTRAEWDRTYGADTMRETMISMLTGVEPLWAVRSHDMLERLRAELDDAAEIARRLELWAEANPAPRGTLSDVADHIEHIIEVAGIDHVGFGSDFYDSGTPSMVVGLEDVTRYPYLVAELLRRGHSDEDVSKIVGLNLLRALRQVERVAAELQQ